ncbi:hypothetical protein [Pseudomonas putida]
MSFFKTVLKGVNNPLSGLADSKQIISNIGDNISDTFRLLSKPKTPIAEEQPVEKMELIRRYSYARATAIGLLGLAGWSFVNLLLSANYTAFLAGGLTTSITTAYYLALCRALYKARLAIADWQAHESLSVTWLDYFNAVAENPMHALPRKLK